MTILNKTVYIVCQIFGIKTIGIIASIASIILNMYITGTNILYYTEPLGYLKWVVFAPVEIVVFIGMTLFVKKTNYMTNLKQVFKILFLTCSLMVASFISIVIIFYLTIWFFSLLYYLGHYNFMRVNYEEHMLNDYNRKNNMSMTSYHSIKGEYAEDYLIGFTTLYMVCMILLMICFCFVRLDVKYNLNVYHEFINVWCIYIPNFFNKISNGWKYVYNKLSEDEPINESDIEGGNIK